MPTCLYGQSVDRSCGSVLRRNASKPKVYFPPNVLSDATVESRYLSFLLEPSLVPHPGCSAEVYRFLWLRSAHPPVAVRTWSSNGKHVLIAKYLNGKGGYYSGRFAQTRIKLLSERQWNAFKALLNQASFWNLPTDEAVGPNPAGSFGPIHFDGAAWIMEAATDNRYHITTRNPSKNKYREACLYLLELSGLRIKQNEIY